MVSGEQDLMLLESLAAQVSETETIEFKENLSDAEKIGRYISALSNSAVLQEQPRGYLVWGIENASHAFVGTHFDAGAVKVGNQSLEPWLASMLDPVPGFVFRKVEKEGKKFVILEIWPAPGNAVKFKNIPYMRLGSHLKRLADHPSEEKRLYRLLTAGSVESHIARADLQVEQAIKLLDTDQYFSLQGLPRPDSDELVRDHLMADGLLGEQPNGQYSVTNLGALLFANDLREFPQVQRKALRVIRYQGFNKLSANKEKLFLAGYASGFEAYMEYIEVLIPSNEFIGAALRIDKPMYPLVAVRELVANALIHQDLSFTGVSPIVEIYDDRIEVSNPGVPLIELDRFVDSPPRSRNEALASLMRRVGICEERGSGWDRIAAEVELHQLPAPRVRTSSENTIVQLQSPRELSKMDNEEKAWAVYLHSCLQYVSNSDTNNQSIRERFGLSAKQSQKASSLIRLAMDYEYLIPKDPSAGRKNMRYLPYWAR